MKADIHPDYHEITVVTTNGIEYKTHSTWGKPGDVMRLDVDCYSHPAWSGGEHKVVEKAQLSKFEKRFGTFLSTGVASADKK
jgi:large subunit ribosomal protein L31